MRIIKLPEVMNRAGIRRSTVYKLIAKDQFPKPVSQGERSVGWVESEVDQWIMQRIADRDAQSRPG